MKIVDPRGCAFTGQWPSFRNLNQEPVDCQEDTGTSVRILGIHKDFFSLETVEALHAITEHLALYLSEYPGINIRYNGHVYVISNTGSFGDDVYKIGMTRRQEPADRVKELSDASVPFSFDVHAIISTTDAPTLENLLHNRFEAYRLNQVNYRKEFFRVSLADIKAMVEAENLEVQWTMAAEAKEYRETVALWNKSHPPTATPNPITNPPDSLIQLGTEKGVRSRAPAKFSADRTPPIPSRYAPANNCRNRQR